MDPTVQLPAVHVEADDHDHRVVVRVVTTDPHAELGGQRRLADVGHGAEDRQAPQPEGPLVERAEARLQTDEPPAPVGLEAPLVLDPLLTKGPRGGRADGLDPPGPAETSSMFRRSPPRAALARLHHRPSPGRTPPAPSGTA